MITAAVFGSGRMGKTHIKNIVSSVPDAKVKYLITPRITEEVKAYCAETGIPYASSDPDLPFLDREVDTVIVASPSNTHREIVHRACMAGKAVFCEKPICAELPETLTCVKEVESAGIPFMVGFIRRFRFRDLCRRVQSGEVGNPEMIFVTTRDPKPFSEKYIQSSGIIFQDMTIHDFDIIRGLAGSEIEEVYVNSACLADPVYAKYGDVDSVLISLKFANGAIGSITNSRRGWRYDQRLEVLGSRGVIQTSAQDANTNLSLRSYYEKEGDMKNELFSSEENDAFRIEIQTYFQMLREKAPSPVTAKDGLMAAIAAEAATRSYKEGRPVKLVEVYETIL